jgi:hypothetical protein
MSKKLRLTLERLSVESFRTDSDAPAVRGTVRGRDDSLPTCSPTNTSCDPQDCPCVITAQTCDEQIFYGHQSLGGGIC